MPVSPKRQAELRRMKKEPVELPAKRCTNCPKIFRPKRIEQRFCCDNCRKEFHRYGAAYGPLKDKLEKLVAELIETKYHALDQRLRMCSEGLARLEEQMRDWIRADELAAKAFAAGSISELQSTVSGSQLRSR